ncbi:hypothetical protein TNCV_4461641 [Trichonephila clavipes]|nr:hypothetical protein TNCV_4461641 [Trichonephila clavipes]
MNVKSAEAQSSPIGGVWNSGEGDADQTWHKPSRWHGVEVRRLECYLRYRLRHLTVVQNNAAIALFPKVRVGSFKLLSGEVEFFGLCGEAVVLQWSRYRIMAGMS